MKSSQFFKNIDESIEDYCNVYILDTFIHSVIELPNDKAQLKLLYKILLQADKKDFNTYLKAVHQLCVEGSQYEQAFLYYRRLLKKELNEKDLIIHLLKKDYPNVDLKTMNLKLSTVIKQSVKELLSQNKKSLEHQISQIHKNTPSF